MTNVRIAATLFLGAALAGCLQAVPGEPILAAAGPPAGEVEPPAAPFVETWEGYARVGAAGEAPAHLHPLDDAFRPVWDTGFVVEVVAVPDVLEFRLDWTTAVPAQVILMVHGPHGAERAEETGWSSYATWHPLEDGTRGVLPAHAGPLCMQIPRADVVEDVARVDAAEDHPYDGAYWYPMVHVGAGAEVRFTMTVTSLGGNVSIVEEVHGHATNAEEVQNGVETEVGPKRPFQPCALSADEGPR